MSQRQTGTVSRIRIRMQWISYWMTKHWLALVILFLSIYTSLPIIAPTLMAVGLDAPAKTVYSLYTPFCHRFAFRSFFLYGEQYAYPLAGSGTYLTPYEAYIGQTRIIDEMSNHQTPQPPFNVIGLPEFTGMVIRPDMSPTEPSGSALEFATLQILSASFIGNEQMGYKASVCERDQAIYLAMLFVALIYAIPYVRQRIRPAPVLLFIWLGVIPIGLDGFSQLLGYPPFNLLPPRETLPIFRVVTGALFGFTLAWMMIPRVNLSMREANQDARFQLLLSGIKIDD